MHIGPHNILFALPQGEAHATGTTPLDDEWKQQLPQIWVLVTETHPDTGTANGECNESPVSENVKTSTEHTDTRRDATNQMHFPPDAAAEHESTADSRPRRSRTRVALKVSVQKVSNRINPDQLHQLLALQRLLSNEIMQVLKRAAEASSTMDLWKLALETIDRGFAPALEGCVHAVLTMRACGTARADRG